MTEILDHRLRGAWTPEGAAAAHLPDKAVRWLTQRIGPLGADAPVAPDSALAVPDSRLPSGARAALAGVVGAEQVTTDRAERLDRAGGLSYLDLLRRRHPASGLSVPDAVVLPADPAEVQRVLEVCAAHDVGVVPFGGGTSVVGGVAALRGDKAAVVALDLERLDRLVSVDPESRIAVLQAGVRGPEAERLLAPHGFTLGHVPQSFERATIGGLAATRSAGQASAGYGRFEDMVTGVRLATPSGEWRLGVAPASAAGPDLRHLAVGSEGALGVITEVAVRVRPVPGVRRFEGFVVDGWERAVGVVRALAQDGLLADVTRLSDVDETGVSLALNAGWKAAALRAYLAARRVAEPCLLVLGWDGPSARAVAARRRETVRRLRAAGAVALGAGPGEAWRRGRFSGPRQRDALLDLGVCVETLETAAYWSRLPELYARVRAALRGALARPVVMCHLSHAYETGASLYFTVLAARDGAGPIGQWERAKAAACATIADGPLGTVSHHHGVGVDHAPYLGAEVGEVGLSVLAAAKRAVDPTGILNPGKLLR
ncbi:alkyldihydroxyacetonephosphate synthase [Amycolatopsis arida]|uniref:Alkyldihydroxyacetonephosphate synthase n=1 Tax=Amycolatopsis arida TaxID=587909 RepID=A0A1I5QHC3_9PSEU|nr:FAD-binding oxidoreductase [Amycolatopsis arida]TDX98837.1 alkyldihydroxyacetonephosphate synthase [Amycolatopsis arida]SFP45450.1 alkyldihydroxyacetonephosphate synthase [Amycolatopsis arida]